MILSYTSDEMMFDAELTEKLERYLDENDIVILLDVKSAYQIAGVLCSSKAFAHTAKKIAVISTAAFPSASDRHIYRTVTKDQMNVLLNLYRSYEPSDKMILLSDNNNYGSMFNFVRNGIISTEEMVEALLA